MPATTTADTVDRLGDARGVITLFALHFLGGSADGWQDLIEGMGHRYRWVPIDLPGFGQATGETDFSVTSMADRVATRVRAERPDRWALVGHSMGAKVASVVARRAEDGAPGLDGLARIVLLAGSPPSPEPIDDEKRTRMLGWFAGDPLTSAAEAHGFVCDNIAAALPPAIHARTVADVLRADRAAWIAWLESGSREDWSARIGTLRTPTLIVAGETDEALGIDAQQRLMAPHFADATVAVLAAAGHLLPQEQPERLARLIEAHLSRHDDPTTGGASEATPDAAYLALLGSDRVSARTRAVLMARLQPVRLEPGLLPAEALATLRAVTEQILPQPPDRRIDLAARFIAGLRDEAGDGWRFANLPPDREALVAGLATLDAMAVAAGGISFAALEPASQSAVLHGIDGNGPGDMPEDKTARRLSASQMRRWFEELRAAATRAYVSHPATLARIGYSGVANGGDGPRKQGFVEFGPGRREAWEPEAHVGAPR